MAILRERVVSSVKVPLVELVPAVALVVEWAAVESILVALVVELLVVPAVPERARVMAESVWVPGATR